MALNKALFRLRAHPTKRLINGYYEKEGDIDVIGVLLPSTRQYKDFDISIDDIIKNNSDVFDELKELDMSPEEAQELQEINDGYHPKDRLMRLPGLFHQSPEERYIRMLKWMENKVAN
jgi:pyruvate formate-lyase activating enzyme-like uncharacterized protein